MLKGWPQRLTQQRDGIGMTDTRSRLIQAALDTLREDGLAAASARSVAARAGANQALVFYHFGTVSQLFEAASNHAVDESVGHYRDAFAGAESLADLLDVGRALHERERGNGNVTLMAQVMSGARQDPALTRASQYAMAAWTSQITVVLERVLATSPVADLIDIDGLAHLISAGFIGLELYDGVDAEGSSRALDTLGGLAQLVDVVDGLGPVARRALRARVGSTARPAWR